MGPCNSTRSDARARQGFSLVELVVTIAILGLLAGVGAPRMFGRASFDDRISRDRLAGSLRYAQRLALATGCEVRVQFTGSVWQLDQRTSCTSGAFTQPVIDPSDGSPSYQAAAAGNVVVTASANPLIFDSRGRSVDGSGTVQSVNLTTGSRTIQVVGETGFVRLP